MTDQAVIVEELSTIIAACVAIDPGLVKLDSRLIDDLGMDSLDFLDVVFAVEKKFSIKMRDSKFEKLLRLDILQEKNKRVNVLTQEELQPYLVYLPAFTPADQSEVITPENLFSFITTKSLVIAVNEVLSLQ